MKKVAIIANKKAGRGSAWEQLHRAKHILWGWPMEFLFPGSRQELRELCRTLDPDKYEAVIIIGGDGTINQGLRGLISNRLPLCPFPGGTANDLAAELGIPADWEKIQVLLDEGRRSPMDLITVNGIPFATVAGIGVGAVLTGEVNHYRETSLVFRQLLRRLSAQIYTAMSAKTILLNSNYLHEIHIKTDIFDEKIKTAAAFVCNQGQLGGDLRVALNCDNNDQRFRVLLIPGGNVTSLLSGLSMLKRGRISDDFIAFSADRVTIKSLRKPIQVFGDGETLLEDTVLDFRLIPNAVQVYRCKGLAPSRGAGGNGGSP